MRNKEEIKEFYLQQIQILKSEISRLKRYNKLFITLELATFITAAGAILIYYLWHGGNIFLAISAISIISYIAVRQRDKQTERRIEEKVNLKIVYEKEVSYLNGDYSPFQDGEKYIDSQHDFTFDLDIFGKLSLFNRINRTITSGGSDCLANILSDIKPANIQAITENRDAIKELADRENLRAHYLSLGQKETIDTKEILDKLNHIRDIDIPSFPKSRISLAIALLAIICFLGTIITSILGITSSNLPIVWGSIQFFIVYSLCLNPIKKMSKAVGVIHKQLKNYISQISIIANSKLESKGNKNIISTLTSNDANAELAFNELKTLLDSIDRRANILGILLFNTFILYDFFIVRRFLHWQEKYMFRIEEWIDAISKFEASVSMATFRFNEPQAVDAEIVENEDVIYQAKSLRHPFLGDKAVGNDFNIDNRKYYIITGANMAGKSTFLRSIGINYILAMSGMPVFADELKVSVFSLFSSMRTTDDLSHGISYFNAELLRLKQLIEACKKNKNTLIILDEILKGTNSLDKLNGSRLFLKSVSSLPVTGVVATHDLELSKMEQEHPERFLNYCFEIGLSDKVTYTYKITRGTAKNQNATFLLNNILKESL